MLEIANGRILIEDENGDVALDTDQRQLVWTNYVSGSLSVPQRRASSIGGVETYCEVDQTTDVADINAAADVVFGAFKITDDGGFDSLAAGGWFQATGTFLNGIFLANNTGNVDGSGQATTPWHLFHGLTSCTFFAAGGKLKFREQAYIYIVNYISGTHHVTLPAFDVDYKIYCGCFI